MLKTVYAKTKESLKTADKLIITFICLILVALGIMTPAFADTGSKGQIVDDMAGLYLNIEKFSAMITDSFSNSLSEAMIADPDAQDAFLIRVDQVSNNNPNRMAMIGNVLGVKGNYTDLSTTTNIFSSGDDQSSRRITLETVQSWYKNNPEKIKNSAIAQYIVFGSMLNSLGIDEFRDAQGNSDGFRMVVGYTIYICYILATSAAGIMQAVVDIMDKFNIFAWIHNFMLSGDAGTIADEANNITSATNMQMVGARTDFMATVRSVYRALMDFRWIILGLLIVFLVASVTVFKSKAYNNAANVQKKVRNLGLRVIIMCISIPLVGMVYTTMIGLVKDGLEATQYRVSDFIFAQFLDYERWTTYEPVNAFAGVNYLNAKYSLNEQSIEVTWAKNSDGSGFNKDTDEFNGNPLPGKQGSSVNASEFVYIVNYLLYPDALNLKYADIAHTDELYYASNQTINPDKYSDMLDKSKIDPANNTGKQTLENGYKIARDLILGYARGNRVVSDTVNDAYSTALQKVKDQLLKGKPNDDQANKEATTANVELMSKIFCANASVYDYWSYVGFEDADITDIGGKLPATYSSNKNDREEDAIKDLKLAISGVPYFAGDIKGATLSVSARNSVNGMFLKDKGGLDKAFMQEVLGLYYQKIVTTYDDRGNQQTGNKHIDLVPMGERYIRGASGSTNMPSLGITSNALKASTFTVTSVGDSYEYVANYTGYGMSPLAIYNFMHSRFSLGTLDIYSPSLTSNSGVSMMHYAITTPFTGIPEIVQLLYTVCILFSIGIIGWVFGISLLMSTIVQTIKAFPLIFKLAIGSIQGFVEALLTVLSIIAELFVTIMLYVLSIQIIDFLIVAINFITTSILDAFVSLDGETLSIANNLISMLGILWGTFELIKWRQAITISIKSMLTHVLNQVFGTSAEMPSGAATGMLQAAAIGGTAALAAGALADNGTLDDVVNDMTQSGVGSDISENLKEGDFQGAMDNIKDYAAGEYSNGDVRGGNKMDALAAEHGMKAKRDNDGNRMYNDKGEALYEDLAGNEYTADEMASAPNAYQELTEDQQASVDAIDKDIAEAEEKAAEAEKNGDTEEAEKQREKAEELKNQRAAFVGKARSENYQKAAEAGVADYASYEQSLADNNDDGSAGYKKNNIEAADIPVEAGKELDADGQAAYTAAQTGDAASLHTAGSKYNSHGLTKEQEAAVDEMVTNGASEEEVAAAVDNFARDNFGENYKDVVDKINEANGRSGSYTYGSSDNNDGNARTATVHAGTGADGSMQYGVKDNNSANGEQVIAVTDKGNGVDYTNMTAGGGEKNTVQTLDLAESSNDSAAGYANTYNSTAAMLVAGGMAISNKSGGMGSANVITVSEMAAKSSQMEMAEAGVEINTMSYGNNSSGDIGTAMTTAQVRATSVAAANGSSYTPLIVTPLSGISSDAAEKAGVATYQIAENPSGGGSNGSGGLVMLERNGGADVGPQSINVNYTTTASQGAANFDVTGLNSVNGDTGSMNVVLNSNNNSGGATVIGQIDNTAPTAYGPVVTNAGGNSGGYSGGYSGGNSGGYSGGNSGGNPGGNSGGDSGSNSGAFEVNVNLGSKESNDDKTIRETVVEKVIDSVEKHLEGSSDDGTGFDVDNRE